MAFFNGWFGQTTSGNNNTSYTTTTLSSSLSIDRLNQLYNEMITDSIYIQTEIRGDHEGDIRKKPGSLSYEVFLYGEWFEVPKVYEQYIVGGEVPGFSVDQWKHIFKVGQKKVKPQFWKLLVGEINSKDYYNLLHNKNEMDKEARNTIAYTMGEMTQGLSGGIATTPLYGRYQ